MQPVIYTVTFVVISHDIKSCQYVPGLRERELDVFAASPMLDAAI